MRGVFVLHKKVGETPLDVVQAYKAAHTEYKNVPMAYAGRLDPMASGLLLVLAGDECKRQEQYHGLDKEYILEVLLGAHSDTADVLGIVEASGNTVVSESKLSAAARSLVGNITLPYPHFSSRTVKGKPLHTWTLEGRLNEIEVPKKSSQVYKLTLEEVRPLTGKRVASTALANIDKLPPVTDPRKALGADFRRPLVKKSWEKFVEKNKSKKFTIARFRCAASSGTYMRSLAEEIAKQCDSTGLAFSIERTTIGHYQQLPFKFGYWSERFLPDELSS